MHNYLSMNVSLKFGPCILVTIISVKVIEKIIVTCLKCRIFGLTYSVLTSGGRTGLMVRASDSGSGDPGSILGRVGVFVSLSKRHLLPKSTGNTQE